VEETGHYALWSCDHRDARRLDIDSAHFPNPRLLSACLHTVPINKCVIERCPVTVIRGLGGGTELAGRLRNSIPFARTCVGKLFGHTFSVGPIGDPAFGFLYIVLIMRVADVRQQMGSVTRKTKSSSKEVSSRTPFGRVNISLRQHAPAEDRSDFKESIRSFFALPP
jgi:hypothetical protein